MNEKQKYLVYNLKKTNDSLCHDAAFEMEMMCGEIDYLRRINNEKKGKSIDQKLEEAISTLNEIKEMREKERRDKEWDQHIEHCKNNGNGWI